MFSMNDDPIFAARAIEIGAKGYVSKAGDPCDLVEAIREVGNGGVLSAGGDCTKRLAFAGPAVAQNPLSKLTSREIEIVAAAQRREKPVPKSPGWYIRPTRRLPALRQSSGKNSGCARPPKSFALRSKADWFESGCQALPALACDCATRTCNSALIDATTSAAPSRRRQRLFQNDPRRPLRQKEEPVCQLDGVFEIVSYEEGRHLCPCRERQKLFAQPSRQPPRRAKKRKGCSSSRKSGRIAKARAIAARRASPERQFARIPRHMGVEAQRLDQISQISIASIAGSASRIFSSTVRQGKRRGS